MMSRDGWLPRTTREKLIRIDTILAGVVPRFSDTRERIADVLPGHSGRPAGNGEPPGGSGGGGATVVERTVLGADLDPADPDDAPCRLPSSPEREALAELDRLAERVVLRVERIVARSGCRLAPPPADRYTVRRLVWARWAIRVVEQLGTELPARQVDPLFVDAARLDQLCTTWGPARRVAARDAELAVDDTERWCRSHLRVGDRVDRSDRYAADGLCRWCGDFAAEQGWLPTLDIVDAHTSGAHSSKIAKLIRDAEQTRVPRPKRRKRSRK